MERELTQVEEILHTAFPPLDRIPPEFAKVSSAAGYLLRSNGKRLRPAILLLSAKVCGGDNACENAVRMAAAMEMIHTATLIHDDMLDGSAMRRGLESVNSRWGEKVALIAGNHLYVKVIDMIADSEEKIEHSGFRISRLLAGMANRMLHGEVLQLSVDGKWELGRDEYLRTCNMKTASFFTTCCQIGAVIAGAGMEEETMLKEYGRNIGLAFQITDDILDFTADQDELGKPKGNDLYEGRFTLPLIYFLERASAAEKEMIGNCIRSEREFYDRVFPELVALLEDKKAFSYSYDTARAYSEKARQALKKLGKDLPPTRSLVEISDFVIDRCW